MRKALSVFVYFTCIFGVNAQLNIDSTGRIDYAQLHSTSLNDVWGYVDELGNEYGLVGSQDGTGVVDVSTPSNPIEVFWEPGMNSVWRDLKTFGDYAYVTTEAQNGLLIIDLSPLPSSTALTTNYYFGPSGQEWQSAHNLYVDSLGYAYIFGANRGNGGVIILDVATDPMNPIEVGVFDDWYVHDGYVLGDTMYLAHISDGFMSIVDITDRSNPILMGTKNTPSDFAHNIWTTADGQYAFTTDELPFSYIGAYDVSDPSNITEVDRIQSSPGSGTIPHNTHVLDNYIVTSHYADGVLIHDVTYPYNMVEVGYYDTYPGQTATYDGCWGAYPFLPSGTLLATDRSTGFFVLTPNYVQASYLEGTITDASTSNPIDLAEITIEADDQTETSNNVGFYATGIAASGTLNVTYSKVGYYPQTIATTFSSGLIEIQDVQLVPIPPFNLNITVLEEGTNTPILGADILLKASLISHEGTSNGLGEENLTLFYEENYEVIVGHWGHYTKCTTQLIDNTTGSLTIYLEPGFYDDFTFDFGWSTSGTATAGLWEREEPFGTGIGSAPTEDYLGDCGSKAYVSGNMEFDGGNDDDIDGGTITLTSPVMDLSTYSDPYINYSRWFYSEFGTFAPDDSLKVEMSNGTQTVQIDIVGPDPSTFGDWQTISVRLLDYLPATSTMQFFFKSSDFDVTDNITEAGVDYFYVSEGSVVGVDEESVVESLSVYPNPFEGILHISGLTQDASYTLFSVNGSLVSQGTVTTSNPQIKTAELETGVYLLKIGKTVLRVVKTNE